MNEVYLQEEELSDEIYEALIANGKAPTKEEVDLIAKIVMDYLEWLGMENI